MDLSCFKSELEGAGFSVPVVEKGLEHFNMSEIRLPFLLGNRDSTAVDSFVWQDSIKINNAKVDLTEDAIKEKYSVEKENSLYKWVLHNSDMVKSVLEKPSNGEAVKLKMGIYSLGFYLQYSKLHMNMFLRITRTTEMYQHLRVLEAPACVLKTMLRKQDLTGDDAVMVLNFLKKKSSFIPLFNEGGSGVYLNVGNHTLVPSYGKNILDCESIMESLSKTYEKVKVSKDRWYYVYKDVKTERVWLRAVS